MPDLPADPPAPEARPPLAVEPLELGYATPADRRPGVLTAVAVTSLVLAVVYGLSAVFTGFAIVGFAMLRSVSAAATTTTITTTAAGTTTVVTPGGPGAATRPALAGVVLSPADRAAFVEGIERRVALTPQYRALLDALLRQPDVTVVAPPADGSPLDPADVAAGVTKLRETKSLEAPREPQNITLTLPTGRLSLFSSNVMLATSDGTIVSAFDNKLTGGTMVTARVAGGTTTIYNLPPPGTPGAGGATPAGTPAGRPGVPALLRPSVGAIVAVAVESAVRLGLAAWLFVAGVLLLRDSPRGRSWHVRWAWWKVPTAVAGAVLFAWAMGSLSTGMMNVVPRPPGTGPPAGAMYGVWGAVGVVLAVFACLYPAAVLVVMSGSRVRDWSSARGT